MSHTSMDRPGDDLIHEHIDLVQHVVNQVSARYPRHVDRQELWNAGACGLVEAARRYDKRTGVPFARYASTRIRGAIIDSTRSRDWATRAVRRNLRDVQEAEDSFRGREGRKPEDGELARVLGIPAEELHARRSAAVSSSLLHLDQAEPDEASMGDVIPETDIACLPEDRLHQREMIGTLRTAVAFLPDVQREVIERYYLSGETLLDIATSMGVTEARVSQIAAEAVNSIRAYLGGLYEGVPEVVDSSPGKRKRAAFLSTVDEQTTWRSRLDAADRGAVEAAAGGYA